jgi:N,N'-diacetyllegionaminate synthase
MIIGNNNTDDNVLVIAEIGNNHEGKMDVAVRLVREAADCGLDAVKFQTYKTELFVNPLDKERYQRMKSFELSFSQFSELADLARSLGLLFISTPLDLESARFLGSIVDAYKIASGDNDFFPLIDQVVRTGKPMIVSTGASHLDQVKKTVSYILKSWKHQDISSDLAILHCVSCYPAPENQVSLESIRFLADTFRECTVGYSDHTIGIDAAVASVASGARIIEKHFTLDKNFSSFRDHQLSADPTEMREMVRRIRMVSQMTGTRTKTIQPCETDMKSLIRRSIAARDDLKTGHLLAWEDLMWIRPSSGIRPGNEQDLLGKRLKRDLNRGEFLSPADVE